MKNQQQQVQQCPFLPCRLPHFNKQKERGKTKKKKYAFHAERFSRAGVTENLVALYAAAVAAIPISFCSVFEIRF